MREGFEYGQKGQWVESREQEIKNIQKLEYHAANNEDGSPIAIRAKAALKWKQHLRINKHYGIREEIEEERLEQERIERQENCQIQESSDIFSSDCQKCFDDLAKDKDDE